jgi:hypothetical protein
VRRVALKGPRIIHFAMDREWGSSVRDSFFSYIREWYQRLEEWISLVIGCRV